MLDPYFSATKIIWYLDEIDGVRHRAEAGELAFGTIDTWLIWNLTAGAAHVTEPSNASRTMLYSLADAAWDGWILDRLDIPDRLLPENLNRMCFLIRRKTACSSTRAHSASFPIRKQSRR